MNEHAAIYHCNTCGLRTRDADFATDHDISTAKSGGDHHTYPVPDTDGTGTTTDGS